MDDTMKKKSTQSYWVVYKFTCIRYYKIPENQQGKQHFATFFKLSNMAEL